MAVHHIVMFQFKADASAEAIKGVGVPPPPLPRLASMSDD